MCDHIMSKPLSLVHEEVDYLKTLNPKFIFIRDENFPLQRDWKEKLKEIQRTGAKINRFASAMTRCVTCCISIAYMFISLLL